MLNNRDNGSEFDEEDLGDYVLSVEYDEDNTNPFLLKEEMQKLYRTAEAFIENEASVGETEVKLSEIHNRKKEEKKTSEQKTGAPPTNEKKTSSLTKAYDTILANLDKVLNAFKNLKLPKDKDTKVEDLDKESRRSIKQIIQDFMSSITSFLTRNTFKPQEDDQKHPDNSKTLNMSGSEDNKNKSNEEKFSNSLFYTKHGKENANPLSLSEEEIQEMHQA